MPELSCSKRKFDALKTCIIIPTYNNNQTLIQVIDGVSQFCSNIIVVNDGSTDHTKDLLESRPGLHLLSYDKNVGKGWALRKGFAFADSLGFEYAITIDSDGQHFASDLPAFLDKLEQVPDAIIIGSRNMSQASVPGKSSFGNKFSNFWFKVETGITCTDTQSGYRLYPLYLLKNINFVTRKYEFEIEVLVRAAWKGVKVETVPVSVYYAPKEVRISHFRPFKDFTRISILNTILVIITFLYIKPRDILRILFNKERIKQFINGQLLHPTHSDQVKAISIAFGVFMGIIPIWGFQLVVAIFLSIFLRLNKALVIIAANISVPPMIPLIIFLSYKMGAFWMGSDVTNLTFSSNLSLKSIQTNLEQYIYGSINLAVLAGICSGLLTYFILKIFKRKSVLAG